MTFEPNICARGSPGTKKRTNDRQTDRQTKHANAWGLPQLY